MENNFNSNDQNNLLLSHPVEKLGFRVTAKRVQRKSGLLSYRKKHNVSDTKQQNCLAKVSNEFLTFLLGYQIKRFW